MHGMVDVLVGLRKWECFLVWYRQEASIQCFFEIPVVRRHWVVDSHEISTGRKRPLNLQLSQGGGYSGQNMPTTKHSLAQGHKVSDRMVPIANELVVVSEMPGTGHGETCTSCKLLAIRAWCACQYNCCIVICRFSEVLQLLQHG